MLPTRSAGQCDVLGAMCLVSAAEMWWFAPNFRGAYVHADRDDRRRLRWIGVGCLFC